MSIAKCVAIAVFITAVLVAIVLALANSHARKQVQSPDYSYAGPAIHVWTDPATKCDYLININGGIHIRYSAEGWHMCEGQYGDGQ